jgi:hypothetical protein
MLKHLLVSALLTLALTANAALLNDGDGSSDSFVPITITPTTTTGGTGLRGYYQALAGKTLSCGNSTKPGSIYFYANGGARVLEDGTPQIRAWGSYSSNNCDSGWVTKPSATCTYTAGSSNITVSTTMTATGMSMSATGPNAPAGCSKNWPLD